jgi:hypothetical protein
MCSIGAALLTGVAVVERGDTVAEGAVGVDGRTRFAAAGLGLEVRVAFFAFALGIPGMPGMAGMAGMTCRVVSCWALACAGVVRQTSATDGAVSRTARMSHRRRPKVIVVDI